MVSWFRHGNLLDQPLEVIIAEFIREKILLTAHDEVPHAVGVVVDAMEYNRRKNLQKIYATVYVERDSQKGIIIGKGGHAIKEAGQPRRARTSKPFWAKRYFSISMLRFVKTGRRDLNQIRRFGYGEGA